MKEVDGAPPYKKRKSIPDANTQITPSPSARTWVQTFNRLTAPFFGVPAFTSPTPSQLKQQNAAPQKAAGYSHVFGGGVKPPVFTFAPPQKKLFPSFQNALRGPQLPSRQPSTPSRATPGDVSQIDDGVAKGTSAKLRKICSLFSKPAAASKSAQAPVAQPIPAPHNASSPAAVPSPAVPSAPASAIAPSQKFVIAMMPGGSVQYRNNETGEVFVIAPDGAVGVITSTEAPSGRTVSQSVGPSANTQPARSAASTSVVRHTAHPAKLGPPPTGPAAWRAPPPSHLAHLSGVTTRSQTAAKRSYAEAMAVAPANAPRGPRIPREPRQKATAVARLHQLSLTDPVFLEAVEVVQKFTEYSFRSHEYIREALHAPRMPVSICNRISLQGNQRLAMLGDTILRLAVLEEWQGRVEFCCMLALHDAN